jgi:hypothetical protein
MLTEEQRAIIRGYNIMRMNGGSHKAYLISRIGRKEDFNIFTDKETYGVLNLWSNSDCNFRGNLWQAMAVAEALHYKSTIS